MSFLTQIHAHYSVVSDIQINAQYRIIQGKLLKLQLAETIYNALMKEAWHTIFKGSNAGIKKSEQKGDSILLIGSDGIEHTFLCSNYAIDGDFYSVNVTNTKNQARITVFVEGETNSYGNDNYQVKSPNNLSKLF